MMCARWLPISSRNASWFSHARQVVLRMDATRHVLAPPRLEDPRQAPWALSRYERGVCPDHLLNARVKELWSENPVM